MCGPNNGFTFAVKMMFTNHRLYLLSWRAATSQTLLYVAEGTPRRTSLARHTLITPTGHRKSLPIVRMSGARVVVCEEECIILQKAILYFSMSVLSAELMNI